MWIVAEVRRERDARIFQESGGGNSRKLRQSLINMKICSEVAGDASIKIVSSMQPTIFVDSCLTSCANALGIVSNGESSTVRKQAHSFPYMRATDCQLVPIYNYDARNPAYANRYRARISYRSARTALGLPMGDFSLFSDNRGLMHLFSAPRQASLPSVVVANPPKAIFRDRVRYCIRP